MVEGSFVGPSLLIDRQYLNKALKVSLAGEKSRISSAWMCNDDDPTLELTDCCLDLHADKPRPSQSPPE